MARAGDWLNDPRVRREAAREERRDAIWREHNGVAATIDGRPATVYGQGDGFMLVAARDGHGAVYAPETVDHVIRNNGAAFTGGGKVGA